MLRLLALKKRRTRWIVASILLSLLGGGALFYWYSRSSLSDFVDLDLRTLDDTQQSALGKVLGQILPDHFPGPRTKWNRLLGQILPKECKSRDDFWHVWRSRKKAGSGFLLFQVQPDKPVAIIHFLASNGTYQGHSEFSTRWPIDEAALIDNELLECPVIEIKIIAALGRQIYGVFENRVALLRFEDHAGKLVGNSYWYLPHQLGPSPPRRSKEEWEELLKSSDRIHVLEGLTWIGGYHRTEDQDTLGREAESLESVRLVDAVRRSSLSKSGLRNSPFQRTNGYAKQRCWLRKNCRKDPTGKGTRLDWRLPIWTKWIAVYSSRNIATSSPLPPWCCSTSFLSVLLMTWYSQGVSTLALGWFVCVMRTRS